MPTPSCTPDQCRDDKARFLLATSGQWLKVRDRATGRPLAYGIPSATRPGLVHLANTTRCTCEDSRRGHCCYHSRAVALHMARVRAEQAQKGGDASRLNARAPRCLDHTSTPSSTSAPVLRRETNAPSV